MSSRSEPGKTALTPRFLLYFVIAFVLLVAGLGWFIDRSVKEVFTEEAFSGLESNARLAGESRPDDPESLGEWVDRMFLVSGLRYTVINTDGVVVADSHSDPTVMENHATRPEVVMALDGEVGRASRASESTGFDQHYVALPPEDGLIVRVSVSDRKIADRLTPVRSSIVVISSLVALVGVGLAALLARRLAAPIAELTNQTLALVAGEGQGVSRSSVRELDQLGLAISKLEASQRNRVLQAERAFETLEMVLGALPQGTVLFSEEDEVVYANSSASELLGAVPDSLSGLAPFPFQNAVRECREQRQSVERVVEHGKPVRRLRAVATPFSGDNRILLIVVDVTDLDRVASIRRDFVANASHELKTPVSAIIASSEALQIAVVRHDDSSMGFAQQIERSARQLDRLVGDLLDLSRLERDQPELDPLSLDLLVREELERLRPVAEEKAIELSMELAPTQIAGSRRDVAIAVRNLLDNAIRYTGAGGSVGAVLLAGDGEAVLRITDTGEGIPTRDLGRVFERFYRVDTARSRSTGGTGLGLAIVKHVVESHGGSVDVESELGRGSVFTVRLPVLNGDSAGP